MLKFCDFSDVPIETVAIEALVEHQTKWLT
jgi:hypothetical protein